MIDVMTAMRKTNRDASGKQTEQTILDAAAASADEVDSQTEIQAFVDKIFSEIGLL